MNQTISEKKFSKDTVKKLYTGDLVIATVDGAMAHDGTALLAIEAFQDMNRRNIWDPSKVSFVIDHVSPSATEAFSSVHKIIRDFAFKHKTNFFEAGLGICHIQ